MKRREEDLIGILLYLLILCFCIFMTLLSLSLLNGCATTKWDAISEGLSTERALLSVQIGYFESAVNVETLEDNSERKTKVKEEK